MKAWDTYNTNDPMNSVQMEQVQNDSYLPSQEQVKEKAGRHANDFLVIGPEPNDESFLAQTKDAVRLYKAGNKGRLSTMNLRKLEKGYKLQYKPFLHHEIAANLEMEKMEKMETSLIPESISQKPDDDDQLLTRILKDSRGQNNLSQSSTTRCATQREYPFTINEKSDDDSMKAQEAFQPFAWHK